MYSNENENEPNGLQIFQTVSKFSQILNLPSKYCQRLQRFCQNGEISSNLVTLPPTAYPLMHTRNVDTSGRPLFDFHFGQPKHLISMHFTQCKIVLENLH